LEIHTFQSLSVEFSSKAIKDRGNPSKYYQKLSTQPMQQKNTSKLDEKKKLYIRRLGIWALFTF
jgi:hypothetical protein